MRPNLLEVAQATVKGLNEAVHYRHLLPPDLRALLVRLRNALRDATDREDEDLSRAPHGVRDSGRMPVGEAAL